MSANEREPYFVISARASPTAAPWPPVYCTSVLLCSRDKQISSTSLNSLLMRFRGATMEMNGPGSGQPQPFIRYSNESEASPSPGCYCGGRWMLKNKSDEITFSLEIEWKSSFHLAMFAASLYVLPLAVWRDKEVNTVMLTAMSKQFTSKFILSFVCALLFLRSVFTLQLLIIQLCRCLHYTRLIICVMGKWEKKNHQTCLFMHTCTTIAWPLTTLAGGHSPIMKTILSMKFSSYTA